MNEFSIEEKAKRYDEAIDKAKEFYNNEECRVGMTPVDLEVIFPELKEFNDKEIKKWLIGYFQQYKSDGIKEFGNGLKVTNVISWLEKQNESSIKWNKNTVENKPSVYHSILMKTTHGIAEGEWKGEYWCQYRWSTNHIKDSDVLAWMELSDLDKSFDKIKPKFKVGDWVSNGACTWRIDLIEDDLYCSNCDRFTCGGDIKSIDEQYHLWTVEDAKDGDILVTENEKPFIFKGLDISHSDKPIAYGGVVDSGYFSPSSTNRWTDGNAYPATKEQRDFLFEKIKEAGFKWNKNKKVLKRS